MALAQVRDVATHAGVSPATVSNALNHPEKVSETTRRRVQAAIEELGYVRNDAARQLRQRHNTAVGMIVLDVANPFFADVVRGAEDSLGVLRRPVLVGNSGQDPERERAHLRLFEEQRVSGLLISPAGDVLDRLREIRDRGTPVVLVDRHHGDDDFPSVAVDDELGGRIAAEHLLELGRRRLAMIGGPESIHQVALRRAGAQAAVDGVDGANLMMIDTDAMDVDSGRAGARRLLALDADERPEAIFAANDLVALGALQELVRAGVRVPEDMALIGYDDIEFAASATVPISSVRQPAAEIGERAATLLITAAEEPDAPPEHPRFTPSLVARESTLGG